MKPPAVQNAMKQQNHQPRSISTSESFTDPCGVIVIDKPEGLTSMDAVAIIRRKAARGRVRKLRVGHAGTLDPLASGVLVVAIGPATKIIDRLMAGDKRYETVIDLSAFTSTDDREGARHDVTPAKFPARERIAEVLSQFQGRIQQRPPAFSAIKIKGRRAYDLARKGIHVQPDARPVHVHRIDILRYEWPRLELRIHCEKGFYVRSLARDLGEALHTGGHCLSIRRTAVGPFDLSMVQQLDKLPDRLTNSDLMSVDAALAMIARHS